jgi:DNA-binding PadR family transcriptional regulator
MPTPRADAERFLPLTPAAFHVLVSLVPSEQHGYAVLKAVEERSDGRVRLGAGTLYGLIKRLLEDGLIVEVVPRSAARLDDPRRRYYRVTALGRAVVVAETERLEQAAARARSAMGLPRPEPAS